MAAMAPEAKKELEDLINQQIQAHFDYNFPQTAKDFLLSFATGSRRLPVRGFSALSGFNDGRSSFTLELRENIARYKMFSASTCFNTLRIPSWRIYSRETMKKQLLASLQMSDGGFAE